MDAVFHFFTLIRLMRVQGVRMDSLQWKVDRKGKFCYKSYYSSLCGRSREMFPPKEIWKSHAPLRTYLLHGK